MSGDRSHRRGGGKTASPPSLPVEQALQASPPEAHGVLMTPFHLFSGNVPLATLLGCIPASIGGHCQRGL